MDLHSAAVNALTVPLENLHAIRATCPDLSPVVFAGFVAPGALGVAGVLSSGKELADVTTPSCVTLIIRPSDPKSISTWAPVIPLEPVPVVIVAGPGGSKCA